MQASFGALEVLIASNFDPSPKTDNLTTSEILSPNIIAPADLQSAGFGFGISDSYSIILIAQYRKDLKSFQAIHAKYPEGITCL